MAPAPKKRRGKKARARASGGFAPSITPNPEAEDIEMVVVGEGDANAMPSFDPAENAIVIEGEDGTVTIDIGGEEKPKKPSAHDDNLAEEIDPSTLAAIAGQLLEAIQQDEKDRSEWLQQRADGLDLLGLKIEKPGTGNVGSASTAVAGQSTVRDALLAEAIDRFQANAFAELCPASGPCKVINYGDESSDNDNLAEEFEKDLNYYLTGSGPGTAKEYYPDTRKMLWWTGYASGMFKKVYKCPLRRRPVSESVDGADLIIPSNATDLHNAGRITHQINMRQSVMRRMQLLGVYRDVALSEPTPNPNALAAKEGTVTGLNPRPQRVEDQDYTVYESYCELDIAGFEHEEDGEVTGLPLPYRVTMDKDSQTILEVRRNWKEDDDDLLAKIPFVLFPYTTGLGFYGTGLLHRLGNYTMALTAMLRESIDAGMFASFPGFLYAKPAGRQLQSEFRVPPGGGAAIDVSAVGGNINNAVMALPYKDVSPALVGLMQQTREAASRYGGTADTPVGEGKQDAPVGTTLAMIEQATKIEGGVHKALHAAQAEELQLLKELFRDDPEAIWNGNRRPAMGRDPAERLAKFQRALNDCEIVPASDPNVPSHMHRLMKANALMQINTAFPALLNQQMVAERVAAMVKIDDFKAMIAPQQGPQPDPLAVAALQLEARKVADSEQRTMIEAQKAKWGDENAKAALQSKEQVAAMQIAQKGIEVGKGQTHDDGGVKQAELQLKQKGLDLQGAKMIFDAKIKQAELDSREAVEAMKIAQTIGVHPEATGLVDQKLTEMNAFLEPAARVQSAPAGAANGGAIEGGDPLEGASGMAGPMWPGLLQRGNVPLANRPVFKNRDGTYSTVMAVPVRIDGRSVLLPTITRDGQRMSNDEAVQHFIQTGEHLGVFDTDANASAYAKGLSDSQGAKLDQQMTAEPEEAAPEPRSHGGQVGGMPHESDAAKSVRLAMEITRALQESGASRYMQ